MKLFSDPLSVLHPFTLLPLIGQIFLIATLFQKKPGKSLTYIEKHLDQELSLEH